MQITVTSTEIEKLYSLVPALFFHPYLRRIIMETEVLITGQGASGEKRRLDEKDIDALLEAIWAAPTECPEGCRVMPEDLCPHGYSALQTA